MKMLVRYLIILVAVIAAAYFVPGIHVNGSSAWFALAVMALVLALVNIFIKPLLTFLSCGFIVLTLGLFLLVINALSLWIASLITQALGVGFVVDGFWPAFWGGIVISIVSFIMNMLIKDQK